MDDNKFGLAVTRTIATAILIFVSVLCTTCSYNKKQFADAVSGSSDPIATACAFDIYSNGDTTTGMCMGRINGAD